LHKEWIGRMCSPYHDTNRSKGAQECDDVLLLHASNGASLESFDFGSKIKEEKLSKFSTIENLQILKLLEPGNLLSPK